MGKHFDQRQELVVLKKAEEVGERDAAKLAGVSYSTVYEWKRHYVTYISLFEKGNSASFKSSKKVVYTFLQTVSVHRGIQHHMAAGPSQAFSSFPR